MLFIFKYAPYLDTEFKKRILARNKSPPYQVENFVEIFTKVQKLTRHKVEI